MGRERFLTPQSIVNLHRGEVTGIVREREADKLEFLSNKEKERKWHRKIAREGKDNIGISYITEDSKIREQVVEILEARKTDK